jgi:hypothetical protein
MSPRTHLILVVYEPKRLANLLTFLQGWARRRPFSGMTVVLNGAQAQGVEVRAAVQASLPAARLVDHDNTGWEFGGYQAGLDSLDRDKTDRLIIANDTVMAHAFVHPDDALALHDRLIESRDEPAIIGRVISLGAELRLDSAIGSGWVRSHLFGLTHEGLDLLDWRLFDPAVEAMVATSDQVDRLFDDRVNEAVRRQITGYLFGEPKGRWYKAAPLTASNSAFFCQKARAILQEFNNSIQMEHRGGHMVHVPLERPETLRHRAERKLIKLVSGYR